MIGHLQSNKVKYIIEKIHLFHSLDRISLAQELQKRAIESDLYVNALMQINISGEKSKFGIEANNAIKFIEELNRFDRIKIKGLMTMAPYFENPNESRFVFKGLKKLSDEIKSRNYSHIEMKHLSMGMTNDYEIAIEEGSNMVRIGTGIYNERVY